MNAIAKSNKGAVTAEQVLIRGDLTQLDENERIRYYGDVCQSLGLNPLTKPFEYITLNGKLRLYALKDCTDQLRSIHGISVTDLVESERDGVFIVKAKVCNKDGRTDVSTGAVNIVNLKGEALANALMKAETKSKRRATLSICGLGLLDETEVDDIPPSQKAPPRVPSPPKVQDSKPARLDPTKDEKFPQWSERFIAGIATAKTPNDVDQWCNLNRGYLDAVEKGARNISLTIQNAIDKKIAEFKPDPITSGPQKKSSGPDIHTDYEGWIKWAFEQINSAQDGGALETFFAKEIDGNETIFPPDVDSLSDAYTHKQNKFKGE